MGKASAPPPPDYAAIAAAQGAANNTTAELNSNLNRVDQYTPTGSVTWSLKPGADPQNIQPGDYVQTTANAPAQQQLQDASNAINTNLAATAQSGLSRVSDAMATPFDTSGMTAIRAPGAVQNTAGALAGQAPVSSVSGAGQGLSSSIDTSGNAALGTDFSAMGKQQQDAIMQQLQPQLDVNREQRENQLLNSGIEKGTQAWDDAQRVLGVNENNANLQAVQAGNTLAQQLQQQALATNQQQVNTELAQANLNNTAQGTSFNQGLSGAQFANTTQNQNFAQANANDSAVNSANNANTTLNNQVNNQQMTTEEYLRELPLNELNSLRTGTQVSTPTFSGYYTGASAAPANLYGAAQDSYNAAVGNTNASNAQTSSNTQAGIGLAASALMAF